jgi:hypothetical protein
MIKIEEYVSSLFSYKGITVMDTDHCVSRFVERHKEISMNFFYEKIREAIDKIQSLHKGKENFYMVVSKSTMLKFPINYRPDRMNKNVWVAVIPTVLDKNKHPHNTHKDILMMVEKIALEENIKPEDIFYRIEEDPKLQYVSYYEHGKIWRDFEVVGVE